MIKKIVAIFLILALIANILGYAAGKLEMLMFWINLGIMALISYVFYGDKKKKKR